MASVLPILDRLASQSMLNKMELFVAPGAISGMTNASDAEVIARSVAEPGAFGQLFDRHFQAVYAYSQRRVGVDLAEEVAAETFTRGFEARERYDAQHDEALPWLLGIAGNVMRRHWRSERRRLHAYARSSHPVPPGVDPDMAGEVISAVARLPRRQREVVLLSAWADLTYEEIARALDLPIGTVRSRLARARSRLAADASLAPSRPFAPLDDVKEPSRV
jgi:RNA polymerase sigma factor (sigma-70 family)